MFRIVATTRYFSLILLKVFKKFVVKSKKMPPWECGAYNRGNTELPYIISEVAYYAVQRLMGHREP